MAARGSGRRTGGSGGDYGVRAGGTRGGGSCRGGMGPGGSSRGAGGQERSSGGTEGGDLVLDGGPLGVVRAVVVAGQQILVLLAEADPIIASTGIDLRLDASSAGIDNVLCLAG